MNSVLREILATRIVSDGNEDLPLHSNIPEAEGALIKRVFSAVRSTTSVEVGFAYGISTLFICDALAETKQTARHYVFDPVQRTVWKGIGLRNIERAGYSQFVELREEKSEVGLPQLLREGAVVDAALIDGWHTFDHTLVDFFMSTRCCGLVVSSSLMTVPGQASVVLSTTFSPILAIVSST